MEPFVRLAGRAAPLNVANIDTDQIAPAQFLKSAERRGLGRILFHHLRYDEAGLERPDFVLNQPRFEGATILVAGDNFGCGSSREHAPWALKDYGIRCVIAPSFADIFANNALLNGILLIAMPQTTVARIVDETEATAGEFQVDLEREIIVTPSGERIAFLVEPARRRKLLKGLDPITDTLSRLPAILAYEASRPAYLPELRRADAPRA